MHTEILQRWITVQGSGNTVLQDEEEWLDMSGCSDATVWLDVRDVSGTVTLSLQSAPSKDDALFNPIIAPTALSAQQYPYVTKTIRGATSVFPLARWVRWSLTGSSSWSATFRIRLGRSRTTFFAPTHVPGCVLWLRSDLGLTNVVGANAWLDQSGSGNHGSLVSVAFTIGTGPNGLPSLTPVGNGYVTGSFPDLPAGDAHTLFAVVAFPYTGNQCAIATTLSGTNNYETGAQLTSNNGPGVTASVFNSSNVANTATAATVQPANTVAVYSSAAAGSGSNVDIFINGTSQGSTPVTVTPSTPLALYYAFCAGLSSATDPRQLLSNGPGYEFIAYKSILTTDQRIAVHRYLGGRYNVSVP